MNPGSYTLDIVQYLGSLNTFLVDLVDVSR
jgi:hypothetical protein